MSGNSPMRNVQRYGNVWPVRYLTPSSSGFKTHTPKCLSAV